MKAFDLANEIPEFEITDAVRIAGAIAVYPADQGSSYTGWMLMPDTDTAEIDGDIRDAEPSEFLNEEGNCFKGDDEFNSWVEEQSHQTANAK